MDELEITCPAGSPVSPPDHGPSVICGVIRRDNDMEPASREVNALVSGTRDPSSVAAFCAGQGVPGSPQSYCTCPVWRAEKERLARARKKGLVMAEVT